MIVAIVLALAVGLLGWVYQALKPPPPKICGSTNGPPLTSPRVKLRDGRHLAYREVGVPKEEAQYKIIICHSYNNSKDMHLPASQVTNPSSLLTLSLFTKCIQSYRLRISTLYNGTILFILSLSSHRFVLGFPKRSRTNGDVSLICKLRIIP